MHKALLLSAALLACGLALAKEAAHAPAAEAAPAAAEAAPSKASAHK